MLQRVGDNCEKWILKIAKESKEDVNITLHHVMDFGEKPFEIHIVNNVIVHNSEEYSSAVVELLHKGASFVKTKEFAKMIPNSTNYYVIVTRVSLFELPYSVKEIYGKKIVLEIDIKEQKDYIVSFTIYM